MLVKLLLGEPIWRKINQRELLVDWVESNITISKFILQLGKRYPEIAEEIIGEAGELDIHLAIFLNGVQVTRTDSMKIFLSNGDEVMIIMPLSGG